MIAIKEQQRVEVFLNDAGSISILQPPDVSQNHDNLIVVQPENIQALINALLYCKKEYDDLTEEEKGNESAGMDAS